MKLNEVFDVIYIEGFDYTFVEYSSFKTVNNRMFHALREEFLQARERLQKWLEEEGLEDEY